MKKLLSIGALLGMFLGSCKEVPVSVDRSVRGKDTTYVAAVEPVQEKMYLVEELFGVKCVNCPAGTTLLNSMNTSGPFAGKLVVVSMHAGVSLTDPIKKDTIESIQDFRTTDGDQILNGIFGGDPGKPCGSFDRLPIAITSGLTLLDYKNNWEQMIIKANEINGSNPVNVTVHSNPLDETTFEIEVKVSYTQAMTGKQAITLYVTENKIMDAQEFPTHFGMYEHNHVFRKAISPWNGLEILANMETKEAGRVFIQRFILNIDRSDSKQSFWKPENMEVVAFVHSTGSSDKKVYQTAVGHLKP